MCCGCAFGRHHSSARDTDSGHLLSTLLLLFIRARKKHTPHTLLSHSTRRWGTFIVAVDVHASGWFVVSILLLHTHCCTHKKIFKISLVQSTGVYDMLHPSVPLEEYAPEALSSAQHFVQCSLQVTAKFTCVYIRSPAPRQREHWVL